MLEILNDDIARERQTSLTKAPFVTLRSRIATPRARAPTRITRSETRRAFHATSSRGATRNVFIRLCLAIQPRRSARREPRGAPRSGATGYRAHPIQQPSPSQLHARCRPHYAAYLRATLGPSVPQVRPFPMDDRRCRRHFAPPTGHVAHCRPSALLTDAYHLSSPRDVPSAVAYEHCGERSAPTSRRDVSAQFHTHSTLRLRRRPPRILTVASSATFRPDPVPCVHEHSCVNFVRPRRQFGIPMEARTHDLQFVDRQSGSSLGDFSAAPPSPRSCTA